MKGVISALVGATVLLSGCASTYTEQTVTVPQAKLSAAGAVLIAVSRDGSYGDEKYPGSGSATANAVRSAFERYSDRVTVVDACSDLACLSSNSNIASYYIVPQILHWEDRATEWSGKPDRMEVKVSIYDNKGNVVASQILSGKSKWMTFGGDHPQDLLPEPVNAYVQSLYK